MINPPAGGIFLWFLERSEMRSGETSFVFIFSPDKPDNISAIVLPRPVLSSVINTVLSAGILTVLFFGPGVAVIDTILRSTDWTGSSSKSSLFEGNVYDTSIDEVVGDEVVASTAGISTSSAVRLLIYSIISRSVLRLPMTSADTEGRFGILFSNAERISTRLMESMPRSDSMSMSSSIISTG